MNRIDPRRYTESDYEALLCLDQHLGLGMEAHAIDTMLRNLRRRPPRLPQLTAGELEGLLKAANEAFYAAFLPCRAREEIERSPMILLLRALHARAARVQAEVAHDA